jgi:hypothetical protein
MMQDERAAPVRARRLGDVRMVDAVRNLTVDERRLGPEAGGPLPPPARERGTPAPLRIAYLVNTYPTTSMTFVRREIRALEEQGVEVPRFTIRPPEPSLPTAADR